jgi:hypothetical protein
MTLPRGATGPAVLHLQRSLLALGYPLPRWGADASLGEETLMALALLRRDHGHEFAEAPGEVTEADLKLVAALVRAGADAPATDPVLRAVRLLTDSALGNADHHYWLGTGDYRGEGRPPWTTNGGTGSDCWGLIAYVHRQPRHRINYNPGGSVVDWIQCDSAIDDADKRGLAWRTAPTPERGDIAVWPSIDRGGKRLRMGHVALIESTARLRGQWTGEEWNRLDVIHVCGPNGRKPAAVRATGAMWGGRDRVAGLGADPRWRSRVLRVAG